jgi:hypothetical protein
MGFSRRGPEELLQLLGSGVGSIIARNESRGGRNPPMLGTATGWRSGCRRRRGNLVEPFPRLPPCSNCSSKEPGSARLPILEGRELQGREPSLADFYLNTTGGCCILVQTMDALVQPRLLLPCAFQTRRLKTKRCRGRWSRPGGASRRLSRRRWKTRSVSRWTAFPASSSTSAFRDRFSRIERPR